MLALAYLRPEEDQSIWSKRRQGFQPCCEAGIREPTLSETHVVALVRCREISESTENWAYMHLFAEKIKKNTFLVVILPQFARSDAIFSKRDYSTVLFSVEYKGIFTTKHDDVQHTHQEGALSMPFFWGAKGAPKKWHT